MAQFSQLPVCGQLCGFQRQAAGRGALVQVLVQSQVTLNELKPPHRDSCLLACHCEQNRRDYCAARTVK
jgi:hypothetical protein